MNSERAAARLIAAETGEPVETVRHRIKEGKKVGDAPPTTEPPTISTSSAKLEKLEKADVGLLRGLAAHRPEKRDQSDPVNPERTAETLAKQHGVSAPTIKRDGQEEVAAEIGCHQDTVSEFVRNSENLPKSVSFSHATDFAVPRTQEEIAEAVGYTRDEVRGALGKIDDIQISPSFSHATDFAVPE